MTRILRFPQITTLTSLSLLQDFVGYSCFPELDFVADFLLVAGAALLFLRIVRKAEADDAARSSGRWE